MAINFPNSPTSGDIFGNFTYDSSIPGWRKTPENSASLPAGTIVQWPGATAPANWLLCQGQAVSRTTYASLFAAIGVQYGAGDGTTTFNLPNLKGRVAVGLDSSQTEFDTLGETGGAKTHTLLSAEMPSHTHTGTTVSGGAHTHTGTTSTNGDHTHQIHEEYGATGNSGYYPGNGYYAQIANWNAGTQYLTSWPINSAGNHNHTFTTDSSGAHTHTFTTDSTGSGGAHNNLQPYIVLNYIIKTSAGITSGDSELATRVGVTETNIAVRPLSPNLIHNGDMAIAQRGTSFSFGTGGGGRWYGADRFSTQDYTWTSGSNITVSNDTSVYPADTGIYNSYKVATGATGLTFGTDGFLGIRHVIEGKDLSPYYSKSLVLSFYVRSSLAGTYSMTFDNGNMGLSPAPTRVLQKEYIINSADTWERKQIVISMSSATAAGTWDYSTGYGMEILWNLGAHSSRTSSTTLDSWSTYGGTPLLNTTTAVQWATGANRTFYITGIQLEEGTVPTGFHRATPNSSTELLTCQRYFTALNSDYVWYNYGVGCTNTTSQSTAIIVLPTEMRIRGTATSSAATTFGSHIPGIEVIGGTSIANLNPESKRTVIVTLNHTASGNFGSSRAIFLISNNTTSSYINVNAEF